MLEAMLWVIVMWLFVGAVLGFGGLILGLITWLVTITVQLVLAIFKLTGR